MLSLVLSSFLFFSSFSGVQCIRMPLERRSVDSGYPSTSASALTLGRRDGGTSVGNIPLVNLKNSIFVSNITVGGSTFTVQMDSGSSDLWVSGNVPNATDTGTSASIKYALGEASGDIETTFVTFGNFTVDNQAFLHVNNASSFPSLVDEGVSGILGLGPASSSLIRIKAGAPKGETLINKILQLNQTSTNIYTFLLGRASDPASSATGQFTIGEVVPEYSNITSQPQLAVDELGILLRGDQHWSTTLSGITGPDGKKIDLGSSIVKGAPSGQLVVALDTGFTLPPVPRSISDAIYGRVQGANYSVADGLWRIPCSQELNISFEFGKQTFPIHPLDVSQDFNETFADGTKACVGAFQPIGSNFNVEGEFDAILGEAFLRNVYTLINPGDTVSDVNAPHDSPYIQMVGTTDRNSAHQDFVNARLGGVDTTGSASQQLLSHGQTSPLAPGEKALHVEGLFFRHIVPIVIGIVIGVILLLGCCIGCICRRVRARRNRDRGMGAGAPGVLPPYGGAAGPYRNVSDPRSAPIDGGAIPLPYQQYQYPQGGGGDVEKYPYQAR